MMKVLDRVFLIFFSRRRRKVGDARLESAWQSASFLVSTTIAMPTVAIGLVLMALFMLVIDVDFTFELKRTWQIAAGCIGVVSGVLLDRRFKKYLSDPPKLIPTESDDERTLTHWYLLLTVAAFAVGCIAASVIYDIWRHT
jgi:hypothetical protein